MITANPARRSETGQFVLRGWHVWSIIGAFFVTVIGVNIAFITLAYQSFPGEDVPRSYVQGLKYNETLEARARQAALGWRASAEFDPNAPNPTLVVRMQDRSGAPLQGASVTGTLRRSVTDRQDQTLTFTEVRAGEYVAALHSLDIGGWQLRAIAQRGADTFELTGALSWTR